MGKYILSLKDAEFLYLKKLVFSASEHDIRLGLMTKLAEYTRKHEFGGQCIVSLKLSEFLYLKKLAFTASESEELYQKLLGALREKLITLSIKTHQEVNSK